VDADNLGVCGCSGGGTQSSYLASVDKRIKAASIACYMSTIETDYDYDYGGEYDGEQTWYGYSHHCTRYSTIQHTGFFVRKVSGLFPRLLVLTCPSHRFGRTSQLYYYCELHNNRPISY
jgi:hypothetical protein